MRIKVYLRRHTQEQLEVEITVAGDPRYLTESMLLAAAIEESRRPHADTGWYPIESIYSVLDHEIIRE